MLTTSWSRYAFALGLAFILFTGPATASGQQRQSYYDLPRNYYGAHLLVQDGKPGSHGDKNLRWARYLVGRWGHAKTMFTDITTETRGPRPGWVDYVNRCYELELVPFIRLAGVYDGGRSYWVRPEPDAPGDYTSLARAFKRVVEGLPRSELCPLYVEVWNEPNLAVEWSGETNAEEYAAFFVQVSEAIRSIGDDRIKILNGGLASSAEWADKLCKAHPKFIDAFDYWSVHPYPMNRPPSVNLHDGTAPAGTDLTIDSYLNELEMLAKHGRENVKVFITETGYDLGNGVFLQSEGHPIIDEYNRADYIMRAFRDYWPKWDEIMAVFPFQFSDPGWQRFDWVNPNSGINEDGSPTDAHYQYWVVAALAKPTDVTGAINGTLTVDGVGTRLEGTVVTTGSHRSTSDPMGNFFFGHLRPGNYTLTLTKPGFARERMRVTVERAKNTIVDHAMKAERLTTLSGVVQRGEDGEPLRGATLRLEPTGQEAISARDGTYTFDDVIPARYRLVATARDCLTYRSADLEISAGRSNRHDFFLGRKHQPDAENMLKNASMEAGGGGGGKIGVALGFEPPDVRGFNDRLADVAEGVAHTGRRSQKLFMAPEGVHVRQITHYGTARPGTRYVAGAWIKVDSSDSESAGWISFEFTENSGARVGRIVDSRKIQGERRTDGQWTWLELSGVAPGEAQRISLNLHAQGTQGAVFFDDAYIGPAGDN